MTEKTRRYSLLIALAECYERDPSQFLTLAGETVGSALVRELIAGLRNEGYIEEQSRGIVRFTARGYRAYASEPLPRSIALEQSRVAARRTFCPPRISTEAEGGQGVKSLVLRLVKG